MEFFHEKDSHSKKSLKNLKIISPIVAYNNKKCLSEILDESEDGRFIESLIGDPEFIKELKKYKNKLGELMDIKYFIDKDFKQLHKKYEEIMKKNESKLSNKESKIKKDESDKIKTKKVLKHKTIEELITKEDYEEYYLRDGRFIYPDSLPWHEYSINEELPEKSPGEKEYLQKYAKEIEIGRKLHFDEKI